MVEHRLRVVPGGAAPALPTQGLDAEAFQAACVDAFLTSQVARGFSPITIENGSGVLERMLVLCGRPAWEVTNEDIDRVVGGLAADGMAASTRRGYVQAFKSFHAFLVARKAVEIEAGFGARLVDPLDEFNASHHVANDSPSTRPPPMPERMELFFDFLKDRVATSRKFNVAPGTTRCSGRCIWSGCEPTRPRASSSATCTSLAARSGSFMCGSGREPEPRGPDLGGCRCWTASN